MERYLMATLLGVLMGTVGRYFMLRNDFRHYPSYPHGVISHLAIGFIASVLGAVAVPALMTREFTAVTFLALAATQFRDIRDIERTTLNNLDRTELVPRGPDYIEGIARVFEARNYLAILLALLVSGVTYFGGWIPGLLTGILVICTNKKLMRGRQLWQIARVRPGKIRFEGPNLFVDNIHFMNLGIEAIRRTVMERGLGVIIEPYDDNARSTLANVGQRMAIAHDAAVQLGIYRDVDTAEFMPLVRRNLDTGRVGLIILPIEKDIECLVEAVRRVPVLESSVSRPLQSRAGAGASD